MKDQIVMEEIRAAKSSVSDAEQDLTRLLSEIRIAPRAEKTGISEALESAFDKLRAAREHLGALERLVRGPEDQED
jgi:hypothetical protein